MNQIYSNPIEKAQTLIEGLKRNQAFLKAKGFDVAVIEHLEKDCETLTREGEAIAREEAALSKHRNECHIILDRLRENLFAGKGAIKQMFDQEQWQKYGVHDKR